MLENARTIAELRTPFPPFKARASRLMTPTLVVNGEDTSLWLRRIGELLVKALPHAEALSVPRARHFPHLENESFFNERLVQFISK